MKTTPRTILTLFIFILAWPVTGLAEPLKNPYHASPIWKIWLDDPSPVSLPGGMTLTLPALNQRLLPDDPDGKIPGQFLRYRRQDWPSRKYAGFFDDVYSSRDNGHSYIRPEWSDKGVNSVRIIDSLIHVKGGNPHQIGATFMSQSTTGMGDELVNDAKKMFQIEKFLYFGNVLLAAPAHTSYLERTTKGSNDSYQALSPILFNSMGSSDSETTALTKLAIAGGYLPKATKLLLKRHGLYPSTLLYLWKASLPYAVPYAHELRHRVAYNAKGDHSDYGGSTRTEVQALAYAYDDTAHLRNMVELAKGMTVAPPLALMTVARNSGGTPVYFLKTGILIRQKRFETVQLRVSTEESFDLQGLPLSFTWTVLHGNKKTTIVRDGQSQAYDITVPYDPKLPKGRTAIALVANNGRYDSNPAVISIFRDDGRDNLRPVLTGLDNRTILPGETVTFRINATDPEGFPVTLSRPSGEVGILTGNVFTWACPRSHPPGDEPVTILASDQTSGNSYAAVQAFIRVRPVAAEIKADVLSGPAPLKVQFSSQGSRDQRQSSLFLSWSFGDGQSSNEPSPKNTFSLPGYFQARLTATGPSGQDTAEAVIHATHTWPTLLTNGWASTKLWEIEGNQENYRQIKDGLEIWNRQGKGLFSATTAKPIDPPFALEAILDLPAEGLEKGTGIEVHGCLIGYPNHAQAKGHSISVAGHEILALPGKLTRLIDNLRFPACPIRLKAYVLQDFNHPGRMRLCGRIQNEIGSRYFEIPDLDPAGKTLRILSAGPQAHMVVRHLQVWSPQGTASTQNLGPRPSSSCPAGD